VYFISGLGVDERVFSFLDLSFCEPVFIKWIPPQPKESLQHYALRLAAFIKEPDATVVGISLGGMMATEMAKANPALKAIIISSNKTAAEFPAYLRRMILAVPFYTLTSRFILWLFMQPIAWIMGAATKAHKQLLKKIVLQSDIAFDRWAIGAIARWTNTTVPPNVIHIHGTADKLLRFGKVNAHFTISGGEQLMVMDKAAEVSAIVKRCVEAL